MQSLAVKCMVLGERRWHMYILLSREVDKQSIYKEMEGFSVPLYREYLIL